METNDDSRAGGEPGSGPVRVAIMEDHQLLSAAISAALEADGYLVAVPALTDPSAVLGTLEEAPPVVALLDLDLGPFGSGEQLLPGLVRMGARVLIVSGTTDEADIGRCLQAGAWGWVPKSAPFEELLGAILTATAGRAVLEAGERDRLLRAWRERRQGAEEALAPFASLTRREASVLGMLQDGRSVERIAKESYVSEATVRTQVRAILNKLGVNSQLEAVAKASRVGWRPPA